MSVLRVNSIRNEAGTGAVEFTMGATFPSTQNFTSADLLINTTGIATATRLISTQDINIVGIMTGTFVGNGFNIANPPGTPTGKVVGLHLIT